MDYALCINGGASPYVSSVLLSKKLDAVEQNSPLENYKVIFRRSTAKPGGG